MKIEKIWAVFFSPAKSTEKIVIATASAAAGTLGLETVHFLDLTRPENRKEEVSFGDGDFVVIGTPTYAGRVPNKIMPYIREKIKGEGAVCTVLTTYGNRSFDDSLMELNLLMQENGFTILGGGAFVCRHAFASALAPDRPGQEDLKVAEMLGRKTAEKAETDQLTTPQFPGNNPVGPYYTPLGTDGKPAVFLKARPVTDQSRCTGCGLCADRCPMGSIREADNYEVSGICIKCQACIVSCPTGAKFFTDEAFLSHKAMLEKSYADRHRMSEIFV